MSNQIDSLKMGQKFKKTPVGEIPVDWEVMPIRDLVVKLFNGGTPDRSNETYWKGSIPWISGADFSEQKVAVIRRYITKEAVAQSATNVIPKGALLVVTRTGVGKLAIAPFDVAISQDITGLIPNPKLISNNFLFWMLNFHIPKLKANHQGTSINGILREDLEVFPLPFPTTREQEKISQILTIVNTLVDKTSTEIEKAKELKKGLMRQLLTKGIGHKKFKKTPIGEIPADWDVKTLSEIGPVIDGDWILNQDYSDSGVRLLQVGDIGIGVLIAKSNKFVSIKRARELNCSFLKVGDILISRMPEPVGRACQYPGFDYDAITAVDVSIWRPDIRRYDKKFLTYSLSTPEWYAQVSNYVSGTTRARIPRTALEKIPLAIPPLNEQREISDILSGLDERIDMSCRTMIENTKLKTGLMSVLLTGKVRTI